MGKPTGTEKKKKWWSKGGYQLPHGTSNLLTSKSQLLKDENANVLSCLHSIIIICTVNKK